MATPEKSKLEWFIEARRRCVDHLRALLSVKLAQKSISEMLNSWETTNHAVRSALHVDCVIAYARPFTTAHTKAGKLRYPIKKLRKAEGFDVELHEHILLLRDRLIAHGDYDYFPFTAYLQTIGDEAIPVMLGINVKAMVGIHSRALAERYDRHFSACANAIEATLNDDCHELGEQAKLYPVEFGNTSNLPPEPHAMTVGPNETEFPRPSGAASRVESPAFGEGLDGYRYLTMTHEAPLIEEGTYVVSVDGAPTEITFMLKAKKLSDL